ncbi:MAG: hypothetical protein IK130_03380 [Oscillospiraceae bacterium]|nr:hypothetical protein [Oscillospiraceae bacterium]
MKQLLKRFIAAGAAFMLLLPAAMPVSSVSADTLPIQTAATDIKNYAFNFWISTSEYGDAEGDYKKPLERGVKSYLCFHLYNKNSPNEILRLGKDFTVKIRFFLPDGTEWEPDSENHIFRNSTKGWCSQTLRTPGKWSATITFSGALTGSRSVAWYVDPMQPVVENITYNCCEDHFVWGKDNWNFSNSSTMFTTGYAVDSETMEHFIQQFPMSNIDREILRILPDTLAADKWSGSCYGMTSMEILTKMGMYLPSANGGINDILNENTNSENVLSLINLFYHLQNIPSQRQDTQFAKTHFDDHLQSQFIERMVTEFELNQPLINLCIRTAVFNSSNSQVSTSLHSVLAYGYQKGTFWVNGKEYTGRILIADPGELEKNALADEYCIYYNTTSSWIIPAYNYALSDGNRKVCYWNSADGSNVSHGALVNLDVHDSVTQVHDLMTEGIEQNEIYNRIHIYNSTLANPKIYVRNADQSIEEAPSVPYWSTAESSDSKYEPSFIRTLLRSDVPNEIFNPPQDSTDASRSVIGDFDFYFHYANNAYLGKFKNTSNVYVHPAGHIELKGTDMQYEVSIVSNEGYCTTDWDTVTLKGNGTNHLLFQKCDDGYLVSSVSDALQSVTVAAHNLKDQAAALFSTNYQTALIRELTPTTIGVTVDTNGDGEYETFINAIRTQDGDTNCDGKCTVSDAVLLARFIAEDESLSQYYRSLFSMSALNNCDLDLDGTLTAFDLGKVLTLIANS